MYERIQKICEYLKKENTNSEQYINKEIFEKFKIYKNWLIGNGAIFDKNIDFPITYGPFHKIGCKSISNINENEAILLIPKSLIINSEDLHFLDKYLENILDDFSDEEIPTIYLTLYLLLEKQNPQSFFKPFIDIIFLHEKNDNFKIYNKWNEKNLDELNDEIAINSFENMLNNTDDIFNLIRQCDKFSKMNKNEFLDCYYQIISKKIDLNDKNNNSIVVPLIDLFVLDSSIKLRYEIYDSENMIFKYNSLFNVQNNDKVNLQMTKSNFLPFNKPSYNKLLPFIVNYNKDEEDEDDDDENKELFKLNNNDFFSMAVSKKEIILKDSIICCNQNYPNNKKMLKTKGFCLLYNRNDYINIKFKFNRGELLTDKYLENIFGDLYQTRNDDPIYNTLKIKIEFNNISSNLLKYYRFMYFYDIKKNAKEYFKYHFDLKLELSIISLSIDFLKNKLKMMEANYALETDIKNLENELYEKKEPDYFVTNLLMFRISEKIILKNQIELLSYILKIMTKYKNDISGYNNIFDYIDKEKNENKYDKEEYTRMKILRFIAYMSKTIDLM